MAARETRRYKHRGITVSFGDVMLPLVGIVAVGLLFVAGKLFFVNGLRPERSALPPRPERSVVETPAVTEPFQTGQGVASASLPVALPAAVSDEGGEGKLPGSRRISLAIDVLAIPYPLDSRGEQSGPPTKEPASPKPETKRVQVVVSPQKKPAGSVGGAVRSDRKPVVVPAPPPSSKKPPAPAKREPAVKPAPKAAKSAPWQVQVGAFSLKDSAAEVSRRLSRVGYKVSVLSGAKFHRVVVQGGATQKEAQAVVSRLAREGFPDAFALPPASR